MPKRSLEDQYRGCEISASIEEQPPLEIEHHVIAQLLLQRDGQIGGRTQDYFKLARDLAQQWLFMQPCLEAETRKALSTNHANDRAYSEMLTFIPKALPTPTENPYHEACRDEHAASAGLLYDIHDVDIVMVLDDNIIAFQLSDVFAALLSKDVQQYVADSLEFYRTLHPMLFPDMARNGLHRGVWLPSGPDPDFRDARADFRQAKPGVYHFGMRPGPYRTRPNHKGDKKMNNRNSHPVPMRDSLSLDGETGEQHLHAHTFILVPSLERTSWNLFVTKEIYVNINARKGHAGGRDASDWRGGLATHMSVGTFEGGDLLFRELGLRIQSPPGSIMLYHACELSVGEMRWWAATGHNGSNGGGISSLASNIDGADAMGIMGYGSRSSSGSKNSGLDLMPENVRPEDRQITKLTIQIQQEKRRRKIEERCERLRRYEYRHRQSRRKWLGV
ncbi:hypothetical protein F5Y19DRAFT_473023 [Xylariaceae sp. FL1651]|nr:hypothetical protein F5Y19DRAFT_473023 [Xylariaceae sp. FL1651]